MKTESWQERLKRKQREAVNVARDFERREEILVKALQDLSEGRGIKVNDNESWESAMKRLASNALVKVLKISRKPIPYPEY